MRSMVMSVAEKMNKQAPITKLLALGESELANARRLYAEHHATARNDPERPVESDRHAHIEIASEFSEASDQPTRRAHDTITRSRSIGGGAKPHIWKGTIVEIANRDFVIATAIHRFDCVVASLIVIPVGAPLFAAIEGISAGKASQFTGRCLHVDQIR